MAFILINTFDSLKNRNFRFLVFGMISMIGGMNVQMLARSQLGWDLTGSSLAVTLVGVGFAPPMLLFSLFGGVVSDRFDNKNIIQLGQLGVIAITTFIAISIFTNTITIYHLIIVSFFQGTFWAFMMPARQSIIAELVDENQLNNAVSLNAAGMSLTTMVSPAIGGLVYHYFGPGMTYVLITFFCIIAIISTSMIPKSKTKVQKKSKVLGEIKEVFLILRDNTLLLYLIMLALVTTLLSLPTRTLFAPYASELLSGGALEVGLMLASIGGGALIGTLIAASIPQKTKKGKFILLTSLLSGLSILVLGFSSITIFSIFLCFFLGLGDAGRRSLNPSMIIEKTPHEYRGRVMGFYAMSFGFIPLGAIPMGIISDKYGVNIAFIFSGLALIIFTMLLTNRKVIRN
ncbi:MAG: MFS transporter [SAR202 cluster bacterium]|nr:MFS transporter [SAR202 cluster bacterium]MQF92845.1 MFS transporter [SAR202 cluster bacterium]